MHRYCPPCCSSFCLAKRSEFRTARPITSLYRRFSTIAVWSYHTEVFSRPERLHSEERYSTWAISVVSRTTQTLPTQATAWHRHNHVYAGWVFLCLPHWLSRVEASLMTRNIRCHAAFECEPSARSVYRPKLTPGAVEQMLRRRSQATSRQQLGPGHDWKNWRTRISTNYRLYGAG